MMSNIILFPRIAKADTSYSVILLILALMVPTARAQSIDAFDSYGGNKKLGGKKTGWFHVEKLGDRWMFVTPEGHGFFSLGVTHAVDCIRKDELNLFQTKFAKDTTKLSDFIVDRLGEWGYNSAGYGALPPMEKRVPYIATIKTEGPRSLSAGDRSKNFDVFDPIVQARLRASVRENAARHVDNPFCLGYVFIDLPIWHPTNTGRSGGSSYVDFFRRLETHAAGRKAYLSFLRFRYRDDFTALKETYGSNIESLDGLSAVDFSAIDVKQNRVVAEDDELFLNEVAEVYYGCLTEELRRVDPHHLICGDRLMALAERTPDSLLKTAAKYVDVISFQPMGTRTMLSSYIDHVAEITGKPVLLADVNTMTSRPAKDSIDTSEYERTAGEHTLAYYRDAASSLSCIGIHRCTIRDFQPWNTKFHRRGLLKADDSPYSILIDYTRRTNQQVFDLVYRAAIPKKDPN